MKSKTTYEFDAVDFQDLQSQLIIAFNSKNNIFDNSHVIIEVKNE